MKIRITLLLLVLSLSQAFAINHIIQFGGSIGFTYSPNNLTADIGDTVTWQGDFSVHPLQSTSVPSGANSFSNSNGNSFTYVIMADGVYEYQCAVHGFSGQINVGTAANLNPISNTIPEINIFPTVTKNFVKVSLPQSHENLFLEIRNAVGQTVLKVDLIANAANSVDISGLYNGMYFAAVRSHSDVIKVVRIVKE